jgi:hypothetical protein
MARIIRKVIQKRLNDNGNDKYIFDSSSSKEQVKKTRQQPALHRKVENVVIARKISPEYILDVKTVVSKGTRFQNRLNKSVDSDGLSTLKYKKKEPSNFNFFPDYIKKEVVDFDVAICVSSYNRYIKVRNILRQLFEQETKYTFKIFLMNDGSTVYKKLYDDLPEMFPEIIYLENKENGGKIEYWKTVSNLWSKVGDYKTHALCQVDDDFVLCDNFVDKIMDVFFEMKEKNSQYMAFQYHIYEFESKIFSNKYKKNLKDDNNQSLDGGVLYDIKFISSFDYSIGKTTIQSKMDASRVWLNVSNKLRFYGGRVYRLNKSFAFHDGNEDSKLNPHVRRYLKMKSVNFVKNGL